MPKVIKLLNGNPITYESADRREDNLLNKLAYVAQTNEIYEYLWDQRRSIEALTAHHLGLASQDTRTCLVLERSTWIRGAFNICIPVEAKNTLGGTSSKLIMRCPMPHKLAESSNPGTRDEKISCEVGTYVWMQENCRQIRIPHLFGFGFSDGRQFTHAAHRPFYIRFLHFARRFVCALLRRPIPSLYTNDPAPCNLHTGYLLLEFIEPSIGQMLSNTWHTHRKDPILKRNLFRSMARLIISLARVPQPRIGSFRFHGDGTVSLTNRPIACSTMILENDGAPRTMQQSDTYTCTEAFVSDMLTIHDSHFLDQPNAIHDEADCRLQMASKTLLRAVSHHFINREHRNGPFVLQFTDFHASNLFVDAEWNITCLIDLEWVCALPVEMLAVPYWLTGQAIDQILENMDEFNQMHQEFMDIFAEEEMAVEKQHTMSLSNIIRDMWESKGVWFYHCLTSVDATNSLAEDYICPNFQFEFTPETEQIISTLWCKDVGHVVAKKLVDKETYDQKLRDLFEEEAC